MVHPTGQARSGAVPRGPPALRLPHGRNGLRMTSHAGSGRVVLVTGAGRGLGRELSGCLAARGDRVIVTARSADDAQALAKELTSDGGSVLALGLDVTDEASIAAAVEAVRSSGWKPDVVVNNAGIEYDYDQAAATADLARVRRIVATNLFGTWAVTQAFLPLLAAGAAVVMVSSEVASMQEMSAGTPGYRVSKAALNA